jgi:hypothetical protein
MSMPSSIPGDMDLVEESQVFTLHQIGQSREKGTTLRGDLNVELVVGNQINVANPIFFCHRDL